MALANTLLCNYLLTYKVVIEESTVLNLRKEAVVVICLGYFPEGINHKLCPFGRNIASGIYYWL